MNDPKGLDLTLILPTMGKRASLTESLSSIEKLGNVEMIFLLPHSSDFEPETGVSRYKIVFQDPGESLVAAMNRVILNHVRTSFFTWLGDDDLILAQPVKDALANLAAHESAPFVFGYCEYIDLKGQTIFTNTFGQMALKIIRFGPNLLPQPGCIIRLSAFQEIKGFSANYNLAFDYDLWIRLAEVGKPLVQNETLSKFRWHPDSMSASLRFRSALESMQARVANRSTLENFAMSIFEPAIFLFTIFIGKATNFRLLIRRFIA